MVFHPPTKLGQLGQLTRCGAPHASSMSRRRSCCKQAQSIPWYHGFEIDPVTGTLKISVCTPSQSTSAAIAKLSRCSRICLAIEVFANQQANKFGLQKPAWLVQPQFQKKILKPFDVQAPISDKKLIFKKIQDNPPFLSPQQLEANLSSCCWSSNRWSWPKRIVRVVMENSVKNGKRCNQSSK